MRVHDLFESRRKPIKGSTSETIEMASDNDSTEIEVEFNYTVEVSEDDYPGGASLDKTVIRPFIFEKKRYTTITPEIVGYIEFPTKFEKQYKALIDRARDEDKKHPLTKKETDDLVYNLLNFVFDNYVEIDTE